MAHSAGADFLGMPFGVDFILYHHDIPGEACAEVTIKTESTLNVSCCECSIRNVDWASLAVRDHVVLRWSDRPMNVRSVGNRCFLLLAVYVLVGNGNGVRLLLRFFRNGLRYAL